MAEVFVPCWSCPPTAMSTPSTTHIDEHWYGTSGSFLQMDCCESYVCVKVVCVHMCVVEIGGDVSCECAHTFGAYVPVHVM